MLSPINKNKYFPSIANFLYLLCLTISVTSGTRQVDLNSFSVRSSGLQPSLHHGTGYDSSGKLYGMIPDDRRTMRQMNSLGSTNLQAAASSDYGYADPEYGNYASAGSHGHGHGHGGGGGGHGHGHGHKKDCNSALGLLGVLGLVSFLQNVLRQMTTTAAPGGRRRRRDTDDGDVEVDQKERDANKITRLMMPLLMRVGQARDGQIPSECTTLEVCKANKILVKELGAEGRSLGSMLSDAIGKMLKEVDPNGVIGTQVENAARTGRTGLDCDKLYKECPRMPPASTPQFVSILQSPLGQAYMTP